jgi:two-component system phosphate regulon sensor histidine kinase PhoR
MPLRRILIVLAVIILLPALFYTGYEINALSTTEKMMAEIYSQQLDAILFSVNQYAWDVVNGWASQFDLALIESQLKSKHDLRAILRMFMEDKRAVSATFVSDSLWTRLVVVAAPGPMLSTDSLARFLRANDDVIQRLRRMKRVGYRKIESLILADSSGNATVALALIFIPENQAQHQLCGFVLDSDLFVQQVLAPKLQQVAAQEFVLGVFERDAAAPIYSTAPVQFGEIKQTKRVWLFPDHVLGIRPQGATFESLARARFYRSLLLIILLDALLVVGAWVVYRNIRREMELARLKSDFVSNVSHELKTPLSLIRMFAETLELGRTNSDAKKQEYYHIIGQETERLTHLVNNLLNFSRIEAGKKQYQFAKTDLNSVVARVLRSYRAHLEESGFEVSIQLTERMPEINADSEAVSEALLNLLDNAVKYSEDTKHIAIKTAIENGSAFIEVGDRGVGIEVEHHQKIFEKFYRVNSGMVHNTKGSGLGLALVKHIMDAHSGEVTLSSRPGEGSRFRLIFHLTSPSQN